MTQITRDGSATIVNGTSDWVYEEELDVRDGFRWSPDGNRIAYWQFDTSNVGIFKLIYNLGAPKEIVTGFPYPGLGVYPSVLNIPYPIPGTTNSAVRVGVVSAQGGETKWMAVPGDPRNNYIARMEWAPGGNPAANELAIEHLNRLQNTNDVLLADASTGAVQQIFRDQDPAWVDVNDEIKWIRNGKEFLWLSERDGWRHAYAVSRDGKNIQLLTPGAYDVISLDGVDEKDRRALLHRLARKRHAALPLPRPTRSFQRISIKSRRTRTRQPRRCPRHSHVRHLPRRPLGIPHLLPRRRHARHGSSRTPDAQKRPHPRR